MLSSGRSRTVSLGEEGAVGLERMEMEEVRCGGILQCHFWTWLHVRNHSECVWKMCLWNGDKQSEMDNIRVSEPFLLKTWKMCIREGAAAVWAVQVIGRRSTVMEEKKERFVHSHHQNRYEEGHLCPWTFWNFFDLKLKHFCWETGTLLTWTGNFLD